MIAEIATAAAISTSPMNARALGDTGKYVTALAERGRWDLVSKFWNELGMKSVFDEVNRVVSERSMPNWDGYGADPVDRAAGILARKFLESLPLGTSAPSVGAEPDGHLTLEWHRSPSNTLSVSIDPMGYLHYAAILGPRSTYETIPFFGEAPKQILDIIDQI